MGVTPGMISMARNGSPKAPGICRTSARVSVAVRDGSSWAPRTRTSCGSSAPRGVLVAAGATGREGSDVGVGAWKATSTRRRAATALPSRVAGSYRQASTARVAASENGSIGGDAVTDRTVPSAFTVTMSTTVASPWPPSGYGIVGSETSRGGSSAAGGEAVGCALAGAQRSIRPRRSQNAPNPARRLPPARNGLVRAEQDRRRDKPGPQTGSRRRLICPSRPRAP